MNTTPISFPAHRDASTSCTELLEFLTDVQISHNGTEGERTQLRAYPRHTYTYDVTLTKDADKAVLDALRTGQQFWIPLWPHAFQRPDSAPTAGIAVDAPRIMQLTPHSTGVIQTAEAFAWNSDYYIAAPAALGRPVADTRSISYVTSAVQRSGVSFRLLNFKEAVEPYTGPTSNGLPTLAPFTANWVEPQEQIEVNANTRDNGNLDLYEVRYMQRQFTLSLVFTTREQILAFRRLMFALKGRLNPFRWSAPGEFESTWRLASDGVSIEYPRPGLATCQLSVLELN